MSANMTETVPMSKLRFDELGLVGRKKELALLNGCFRQSKNQKQVIMIGGASGTGKSSLAWTAIQTFYLQQMKASESSKKQKKPIFASGKFDLNSSSSRNVNDICNMDRAGEQCDEPQSTIIKACRQMCKEMLAVWNDDRNAFNQFVDEIEPGLRGMGLQLLKSVIPAVNNLKEDPGASSCDSYQATENGYRNCSEEGSIENENVFKNGNHRKEILEGAFKRFLQIACPYFRGFCRLHVPTFHRPLYSWMICSGQVQTPWTFWKVLLPTADYLVSL